nr:12874_t:CDS:2 [Entrophospora candida]
MESTLKSPIDLKEPCFTLDSNLDSTNLVQASQLLLKRLSTKLKQSFRLVVTFSEEKACFRLCLDTSLWFDVYLRTMPDFDKAITKRQRKKKHLLFVRTFLTVDFPRKIAATRGDHPDIICKGKVVTRYGRKTTCNYYFTTKLVVNELSNEEYIVLLRREPIRELLLVPCPNDNEKENYKHFTNEKLVEQESFWKYLLSKQRDLGFHSIAINYGAWETGQSQKRYTQECHAHAHLYFTLNTWDELKKRIKDEDILLKFNTRDFPGPNYLLQDCDELEEKRLQQAEHLAMLNAVSDLKTSVSDLKTSFSNLTTSFSNLTTSFSNLTTSVSNLTTSVEKGNEKTISTMNDNTLKLIDAIKNIGKSNEK